MRVSHTGAHDLLLFGHVTMVGYIRAMGATALCARGHRRHHRVSPLSSPLLLVVSSSIFWCLPTSQNTLNVAAMSANIMDEEESHALLPSTSENLASIKVFPLIPSLKRDVVVSLPAMFPALQAPDDTLCA